MYLQLKRQASLRHGTEIYHFQLVLVNSSRPKMLEIEAITPYAQNSFARNDETFTILAFFFMLLGTSPYLLPGTESGNRGGQLEDSGGSVGFQGERNGDQSWLTEYEGGYIAN